MNSKPMSWTVATLLFVMMMTFTFVLDMAFSPSLRHQAASIHSDFWRIAIPADLVADAIRAAIGDWKKKNGVAETEHAAAEAK